MTPELRYLDCGCCITPNGREWCPTCLDPPKAVAPDLTEALARLKALEEELRKYPAVGSMSLEEKWADEIAAIRNKLEGK